MRLLMGRLPADSWWPASGPALALERFRGQCRGCRNHLEDRHARIDETQF
jgi:hypothetical protein